MRAEVLLGTVGNLQRKSSAKLICPVVSIQFQHDFLHTYIYRDMGCTLLAGGGPCC
jgi:hypothetical protein